MSQCIDQLTKALGVIATDPKIVSFLQANDPQALKQCQEALRNYFNQFEDEDEIDYDEDDYAILNRLRNKN